MPAPAVSEIRVDLDTAKEQDIIHQTVQQVYAINRDDFNTREILMMSGSGSEADSLTICERIIRSAESFIIRGSSSKMKTAVWPES